MNPDKRKKSKYKSEHGAVTIFLTLILLPCMIFTCAFGDISRVMLSKAQAEASADLALYSLLANYDEELKDWYGLVSSVQDIDDFYSVSAEYFNGMMSAAGIDGTGSKMFTGYLSSLQTGGSFADFLQAEITGETEVEEVSNAALGENPALIEDGIVEFMKYRGPVEIVANLVERFASLNVLGDLTSAKEDEPIVEKKQEFAQAEGDMLAEMLYTYLAILQYENYRTSNSVPDFEKYQDVFPEHLSMIRDELQSVTELITKYYACTDQIADISGNFRVFSKPSWESEKGHDPNSGDRYDYDDIGAEVPEAAGEEPEAEGGPAPAPADTHTLNDTALRQLFENVDTYIDNIERAAGNVVSACGSIEAPSGANSDVNSAVYCMKIQSTDIVSQVGVINDNAKLLMQKYAKMLVAQHCELPEYTDWDQQLRDKIGRIDGVLRDYLTYNSANTSYETILSQYRSVAGVTVNNVKNRTYEFLSEYCNGSVTIGGFFEAVRGEFEGLMKHLQAQIANIDLILNGGSIQYEGKTYTVVSLSTLKGLVKKYTDSREDWGNEAYSHDTQYARQEQTEYVQASEPSQYEEMFAAALGEDGEEAIEELRTRMTNIQNDMKTLQKALEEFTYGGTSVYTLSRDTAISSAKTVVPSDLESVSLYLSQNEQAAAGYNASLVKPSGSAVYTAPVLDPGEEGNDPDLDNGTPKLYEYMRKAIPKDKVGDVTAAKDDNDRKNKENENKAKALEDESKGFDAKFVKNLGEEPTGRGGTSFGGLAVISSLVGVVEKILSGNFDEFRDQIYVTEYVMDMFSYSTFDNQGEYKIGDEKNASELTYKGFCDGVFDCFKDEWENEDATELYGNQSLTNRQINQKNNYSHLAEVEYILYGQSSNEENLKRSYESIFAVRELLNLVAGFQNFYFGSNRTAAALNTIAEGIQTATMGIVPIPLTKVVLIGFLATMESAYDMNRLKAGVPVALYKYGPEKWYYSLDGCSDFGELFSKSGLVEPEDSEGLFYSDYLYLALLLAANSGMYSDMLLRIGDVIEANMHAGGRGDFDLSACKSYFRLTSGLRVKPLLLTLPIVDSMDDVDVSSTRESTDWCTYKISVIRGYS